MACSTDTFGIDDDFQVVFTIPSEYVQSAKSTIETICGGAIRSIHTRNHSPKVAFGYVTFESGQVAARAISSKLNWPNGQLMCVTKQPKLDAKAFEASHFDALNDDCLFHLYQFLNPLDIANAAEAYQCLAYFAAENICQKYATFDVFHYKPRITKKYSLNELKCVFKHFGQHVTHCSISDIILMKPTIKHVMVILQSCPNLVQIRFEKCAFRRNALETLCSAPLRASEAFFIQCTGITCKWSALWTKWSCLRSLHMQDMDFEDGTSVLSTLENLDKLSLERVDGINGRSLIGVVSRNQATLTSLSLLDNYTYSNGEVIPNLPQLEFYVEDPSDISQLLKLNNLNRLEVIIKTEYFKAWLTFPESFKTIEELDLIFNKFASDIFVLSIWNRNQSFGNAIIDTVSKLPHLKQLIIRPIFCGGDDLIMSILERNHSVHEIFLHDSLKTTLSVPKLLEFLTKLKSPRPTVRITVFNNYSERFEIDHNLLKIKYKRTPDNDNKCFDNFNRGMHGWKKSNNSYDYRNSDD